MRLEVLRRLISCPPLFASALVLAGCWAAPVATVQPKGEARLIQDAIAVTSVKDLAVVSSVDRSTGTIDLRTRGRANTVTYPIAAKLSGLDDIKAGDVVQAAVAEELAIYVSRDGQPPGVAKNGAADARVLAVDPSYRLLTIQYLDGQNETFKVPLGTKLEQMQAGESVVIRPLAVLALRHRG